MKLTYTKNIPKKIILSFLFFNSLYAPPENREPSGFLFYLLITTTGGAIGLFSGLLRSTLTTYCEENNEDNFIDTIKKNKKKILTEACLDAIGGLNVGAVWAFAEISPLYKTQVLRRE
jgi:hypothetical protein